MAICATAAVALATVVPCTKLVYRPVMLTVCVSAALAAFGEMAVICEGGFTVSAELLRLSNFKPAASDPAMVTLLAVGSETAMAPGMTKVMRRFPPETGSTEVAVVVAPGPPPLIDGWSVTVTLAGGIFPVGKPLPVTLSDPTNERFMIGS